VQRESDERRRWRPLLGDSKMVCAAVSANPVWAHAAQRNTKDLSSDGGYRYIEIESQSQPPRSVVSGMQRVAFAI
jgi:hypothetical protein